MLHGEKCIHLLHFELKSRELLYHLVYVSTYMSSCMRLKRVLAMATFPLISMYRRCSSSSSDSRTDPPLATLSTTSSTSLSDFSFSMNEYMPRQVESPGNHLAKETPNEEKSYLVYVR